jgi:hypothetical protein
MRNVNLLIILSGDDQAGGIGQGQGRVCALCMNGLEGEAAVETSECGHRFCRECIDEWFEREFAGEQSGKCPECGKRSR